MVAYRSGGGDGNHEPHAIMFVGQGSSFSQLNANRNSSVADVETDGKTRLQGNSIKALAFCDVDNDGDLDLIVGRGGGINVQTPTNEGHDELLLNDGAGSFAVQPSSPFVASITETYALATGDVNGDGNVDVVVGKYGKPSTYAGPDWLTDEEKDTVRANYQQAPNELWLGDGAGGFTAVEYPAFSHSDQFTISVALGDVDGDNDLDLLVGNCGHSSERQLYFNDGAGTFTPASSAHTAAFYASSGGMQLPTMMNTNPYATHPAYGSYNCHPTLILADVDGDGDLDVLAKSTAVSMGFDDNLYQPAGFSGTDSVYLAVTAIFLNGGDGTFTLHTWRQEADTTHAMAVADFDGGTATPCAPTRARARACARMPSLSRCPGALLVCVLTVCVCVVCMCVHDGGHAAAIAQMATWTT